MKPIGGKDPALIRMSIEIANEKRSSVRRLTFCFANLLRELPQDSLLLLVFHPKFAREMHTDQDEFWRSQMYQSTD